jgi:tRNA (guanine37-N1)-methyltransferase
MAHVLKSILKGILSPEDLSKLYSAFDMIGGIVILKIPYCLSSKKQIIAQTILANVKSAKSVFAQTSPVQGEFRIRNLEYLAGSDSAITEYKEHGCRFKVDVRNTYFSPRLSAERFRIANMITKNEIITNMFAGVGTYSVLIAKTNKSCIVYSVDSNPAANELGIINAKLNKVDDRVISIHGDARGVINERLRGSSTRVLMPLPEDAMEYVGSAVLALKQKRGIIHYFSHVRAPSKRSALDAASIDTKRAFVNYDHNIIYTRVVREVGPRFYQTVSDVFVTGQPL